MGITYFIDSENVGDNWISLLSSVTVEDEILVFYTANSPHMNYRNLILLKESDARVSFIECFEGSNALDFQLCTELGYRLSGIGDGDFIIVSNDTGYDAIVKYWKKRDVSVRRMTGRECVGKKKANAPKKASTASAKQAAADRLTQQHETESGQKQQESEIQKKLQEPEDKNKQTGSGTSKKHQETADFVDDNAKELLFIIGKDNLQDLHGALQLFYGNKKAKSLYNAVKSGSSYSNFLSKHKAMTIAEKQEAYCRLVFETGGGNGESGIEMPDGFSAFVTDTWKKKKNLNSFRAALQSKYGKEHIEKYYGLIKAHIKILDRIDPADRDDPKNDGEDLTGRKG